MEIVRKLRRYWKAHGTVATLRFLRSRVLRSKRYLVYQALLNESRSASQWARSEELDIIDRKNLERKLDPELLAFLGGPAAEEYLDGVRHGDRLFIVTNGNRYVHYGYVMFNSKTTRIFGEKNEVPLIGNCFTAEEARGLGIYRKALNDELRFLHSLGFRRAVIETDPKNYASRKGIEAAGFRFVHEVRVWIVFNLIVLQQFKIDSGVRHHLLLLT